MVSYIRALEINPLSDKWFTNVLSHSVCGLFSHWWFLLLCRSFGFWCSHIYFCLCCLCFWCHTHEIIAKINVMKRFPALFKDPSYPMDLENPQNVGRGSFGTGESWMGGEGNWQSRQSPGAVGALCSWKFLWKKVIASMKDSICLIWNWGQPQIGGKRKETGVYHPCLTDTDSEAIGDDKYWNTAQSTTFPSGPWI